MIDDIAGKVKFKDSNVNTIKQSYGNLLDDESSISNEFNSSIVNVGKNIENNILQRKSNEQSRDTQNVSCHNNKSIFFNPICKEEIEKIIINIVLKIKFLIFHIL